MKAGWPFRSDAGLYCPTCGSVWAGCNGWSLVNRYWSLALIAIDR